METVSCPTGDFSDSCSEWPNQANNLSPLCQQEDPNKSKNRWDQMTAGLIIFFIILIIVAIFFYLWYRRNNPPSSSIPPRRNPPTTVIGVNPVVARIGASSFELNKQDTTSLKNTSPNNSSFVNGSVRYNNGLALGKHGAANCNKSNTRFWGYNSLTQTNQCQCVSPFYGPECNLESFDQSYIAVGAIDPNQFEASLTPVQPVDRLSFPLGTQLNNTQPIDLTSPIDAPTLCTNICTTDPDCYGVYYHPASPPDYGVGTISTDSSTNNLGNESINGGINQTENKPGCQLLYSLPIISTNQGPLIYDSQVQSTLFLRDGLYPIFPDRAFLYSGYTTPSSTNTGGKANYGAYPTRPIRPWLQPDKADNLYQKTTVILNMTSTLDYRPTYLINTSGRTVWISPENTFTEYIYIDPPSDLTEPVQSIDQLIPAEWGQKILYAKLI